LVHRHIYDEEDLAARLRSARFSCVDPSEPGRSTHQELRGLERHGDEEWVKRAEAMCLEAVRPA
jgi:hypothetical protein